jgi:energy-coupling factor transport system ATP-binding protein
MTDAAALTVSDVSFTYRSRPGLALNQVSFELHQGELLLVAGTSGCGKTTLMRCVNGLIPRSYRGELSGSVRVHGEEVRGLSLAKLAQTVGTLLQDSEKQILGAFVHAEVAFGLENLGLPVDEIEARVTDTLKLLGIEHLRERETHALSGGEKQKVALAGVLAMNPSLLLLDEPLSALDPASARGALEVFRQLADAGSTIMLVEHRVEDALGVKPDRVLYMEKGEIRYLGPPDGLAEVADWRQVKLPAGEVMRRVRVNGFTPAEIPPAVPGGDPLIEFQDVGFHYEPGVPVLRDINLQIRRGERVALLGPNGAGKSTLVKHAIGLVKPKTGRVLLEGRDTHTYSVAQIARTIGYCFQSPTHMLFAPTVREELAFGPRNLGYKPGEISEFSARALTAVNLAGREEDSPLALSFGQQKRVTIACVMAMRSRILALDEPTAGQDFGNYTAFMDSLLAEGPGQEQLGQHFDAVLFITHDLDLALTYASRVILVADRTVAADGPPEQVLADRALLERCRIVPTSLLAENLRLLPHTGRFLRAEALARMSAS